MHWLLVGLARNLHNLLNMSTMGVLSKLGLERVDSSAAR
jgi:hypothetical protein